MCWNNLQVLFIYFYFMQKIQSWLFEKIQFWIIDLSTCKSAYACKRLDKYIHTCRDSFSSSVFVEQGSTWLIATRASRSSRGEGRHCDMLSVSVLAGVSGRVWVSEWVNVTCPILPTMALWGLKLSTSWSFIAFFNSTQGLLFGLYQSTCTILTNQ